MENDDVQVGGAALRRQLDSGVSIERLRHEQEQARYNEFYLLAPVGYFVVGFDGAILQANLVGARMLGIARGRPGAQRLRAAIAEADQARFDAFFQRALNCLAPERCRLSMRCAGEGAPVEVAMIASADGSGQACRMVVEPVADRMAALERSEERFRRIVHCADEGIWEVDAFGLTAFVNPKMAELLGCAIEDMLEQPLARFMDEEGRAVLERCIARRQQGVLERSELKFVRVDGSSFWASVATNPIFDAGGRYLGALALVNDITERRAVAERAWHQANYDALTGLPNRHMFMDRLALEMRKADRSGAFLALLFIDLDRFKDVNDRLGHAMGDALLAEAARRIGACVRASDTLARLGGDEFTLILAGLERVGGVDRIVQEIVATLAQPFQLEEESATISASIGIALYPADAGAMADLIACADQAMYAAKNGGRNRFGYFTPELQQAALARQRIAHDLRTAIAQGQFEILYQPIVELATGAVRKAEALLRWRHPERGLLAPAEFIPFAESNGLIVEIGDWVFREAARQVRHWQRTIDARFQISVNKSPVQFRRDAALYQGWLACLRELELPPESIVIEIDEGVLMDGVDQVIERLRQYRAMGLQVALDHFGTGYSSLTHLKRFDIDYVKIDQSFVATLEDDNGDLAMCEAIIAMAHKLGLKVVAEGVQTRVQRALLQDAGCDYAQGYMLGHPMSAAELEKTG
jgi:diguanylate cyclase (GGDEF)-like protein/PAS domain S-box-containing protein